MWCFAHHNSPLKMFKCRTNLFNLHFRNLVRMNEEMHVNARENLDKIKLKGERHLNILYIPLLALLYKGFIDFYKQG